MGDYAEFLAAKSQLGAGGGFEPLFMPSQAFDFQEALIGWNLRRGRSATFADCGLGKTLVSLAWGENVVRHTGKPVLYLNPLAVSFQAVAEAEKFDIEAHRTIEGRVRSGCINVTNYQRLHHFSPDDFGGVVCGESSILKSFDGSMRQAVTEFMKKVPYRLLETATAAPNDYIELGTSSEALGELGYTDMLTRFFKNDQNTIKPVRFSRDRDGRADRDPTDKWRFKGHAEQHFWRWVSSWARAIRKPSDLGFSDDRFILPPLTEQTHLVELDHDWSTGMFELPAVGLQEQRAERSRSVAERCERLASLIEGNEAAFIWCNLNVEGDLLERLIPDCVQVSGADSDDAKEEKLLAFARGQVGRLITKPKIGAWGLNFQHCAHVIGFPSHSFEQYYQIVRRCWRFGQTRPVRSDLVITKGEVAMLANLMRKAQAADRMFSSLAEHMNNEINIARSVPFDVKQEVPKWL